MTVCQLDVKTAYPCGMLKKSSQVTAFGSILDHTTKCLLKKHFRDSSSQGEHDIQRLIAS